MTISKIALTVLFLLIQVNVAAKSLSNDKVELTDKQVRALRSLNDLQDQQQKQLSKTLRLKITKLSDNQGQEYIGAIVSRAELSPYLAKLETLLGDSFGQYRERQAARDHQLFHMTLLSPQEYQLADKGLIEKLLAPNTNSDFTNQLNVTLLGLGKVELDNKQTFFVVAQSGDAQLIRQRFLLKSKDFHITLGFNPSDIYGVKKDSSTLID
tara:strand:- start:27004 stop:27636 length:633 start_codon:yes stop_codon:yes gene_type:complete